MCSQLSAHNRDAPLLDPAEEKGEPSLLTIISVADWQVGSVCQGDACRRGGVKEEGQKGSWMWLVCQWEPSEGDVRAFHPLHACGRLSGKRSFLLLFSRSALDVDKQQEATKRTGLLRSQWVSEKFKVSVFWQSDGIMWVLHYPGGGGSEEKGEKNSVWGGVSVLSTLAFDWLTYTPLSALSVSLFFAPDLLSRFFFSQRSFGERGAAVGTWPGPERDATPDPPVRTPLPRQGGAMCSLIGATR